MAYVSEIFHRYLGDVGTIRNIFGSRIQPRGADVASKGLFMSLFSVVGIFRQMILVPFAVSRLSDSILVLTTACAIASAQVILGLSSSMAPFLACLVVIAAAQSILKTVMATLLTKAAGAGNYGEVLGMADSIFSVCRANCPLASGMLVEAITPAAPLLIGGTFMLPVAISGFRTLEDVRSTGKRKEE